MATPKSTQPLYTLDAIQRIAALPLDATGDPAALRVMFSMIGDHFAEHAIEEENKFEFHITDSEGRVISVNVSDRPPQQ